MKSKCSFILKASLSFVLAMLMLFGTLSLPERTDINGGYMSWPVIEYEPSPDEIAKYGPEYEPGIHTVYHDMNLDAKQARQMLDALLQDLNAGRFSSAALQQTQQAIENGDQNASLHDLSLEIHYRREDLNKITAVDGPQFPATEVSGSYEVTDSGLLYTYHIRVPYSATNTIAAAQQLTGGKLYG